GALTHYGPPDSPLLSRRALALGLIACLHVGLIWAFANGLLPGIIKSAAPDPLQGTFLPAVPRTTEPLPPVSNVQLTTIAVPRIIADLPPLPADPGRIEGSVVDAPVPPPHGSAPTTVQRVVGGPGRGFPNTADYYPAQAIRMNEQGGASVSVCVNEAGLLTSAPAIAQSSGSARLDAGALKLARAGSGHYRPTTEGGRPVSACYAFRIRFTLPD
ncbi:MAG: energy transducer TonB, partial [Gammaproteobacteria bacterium]|nr:energy transducer TonB [Gammaproteobacteria bacterium]